MVFVEFLKNGKPLLPKFTSPQTSKWKLLRFFEIYQTRFQIEFVYRDAKQDTSLTSCQARKKEKLYFHFNMSLTAVNVAKIVYWYSMPIETRKSFSL